MSETFWQKIRKNHFLVMVLCCLTPIALILGFLYLFKGSSNYWIWLIILLCPVLHILMMRGHESKKDLYQCPECGFWYNEKEWAEQCEAWCKEHKTCNLEIIKHAVKVEEK